MDSAEASAAAAAAAAALPAHFNRENMMKAIVNPIEYAKTAVAAYASLYGSDLVSVILYGSAAGGDFNPEKSDINLLIVLSSMDPELIAKSAGLQEKFARRRFSRPLFMDKEYIANSYDSYPMEFLDMKEWHRVLFGEDILMSVAPATEHLRLQVERELKGKWLHLVQEFTVARKNRKRLLHLARLSLKSFSPVFRALLKLKAADIPADKKELFAAVESSCSIAGRPLQNIEQSCMAGNTPELEPRFISYVKAIKRIIDTIENK
ncbi:MAG: nucleotidyltransferase domain-containing protein [Chitinispirillaceae bacterium]|nr:nucleotidyltransferase domain-containing protein [Chitinispirillaceae bacterium]